MFFNNFSVETKKDAFIKKAKEIHGDKYSYDKVDYQNSKTHVILTCPKHGDFLITPDKHINSKQGCPKCGIEKHRLTKEQFIEKAKAIHGDKYGYDKVEYINNDTKVIVTCPKHGDFEILPRNHLSGIGCKLCYYERKVELNKSSDYSTRRLTNEQFIEKAKEVHGNKYSYDLVKYINNREKVKLICPKHGIFEKIPLNLLEGQGCPKCSEENKRKADDFFKKAKEIHNDKYSYFPNEYKNYDSKIKFFCKECNRIFTQTAKHHLTMKNCPCTRDNYLNNIKTKEDFIRKAKEVHGDKYNYDLVNFRIISDKVDIICPEHGLFSQKGNDHLTGHGCPLCNESYLEKTIAKILNDNDIKNIRQYKFNEINNRYSYDFYLPDYNLLIEVNGEQHYKVVFNKEEMYNEIVENDKMKTHLAFLEKKALLIIKYDVKNFIETDEFKTFFLNTIEKLKNYIPKNKKAFILHMKNSASQEFAVDSIVI